MHTTISLAFLIIASILMFVAIGEVDTHIKKCKPEDRAQKRRITKGLTVIATVLFTLSLVLLVTTTTCKDKAYKPISDNILAGVILLSSMVTIVLSGMLLSNSCGSKMLNKSAMMLTFIGAAGFISSSTLIGIRIYKMRNNRSSSSSKTYDVEMKSR